MFLLFLPTFFLDTAFHYLILCEKYELFNNLVESVEKYFEEFINNEFCINRIIDMFVYVLENVTSYSRSALKKIYCDLLFETNEYEKDESSEDFDQKVCETNNIILKNVETIETYLSEIRKKVEGNKR